MHQQQYEDRVRKTKKAKAWSHKPVTKQVTVGHREDTEWSGVSKDGRPLSGTIDPKTPTTMNKQKHKGRTR